MPAARARLVDVATLTGAILSALGRAYAGLFADDDAWAALVAGAAERTGERVWRMPLDAYYAELAGERDRRRRQLGGNAAWPVAGGAASSCRASAATFPGRTSTWSARAGTSGAPTRPRARRAGACGSSSRWHAISVASSVAVMASDAARRSVGTYDAYVDAQRAVDTLSDKGFPVGRVSIVGRGLRLEEQVLGRETVATAALRGAGSGALIGALFGLFLWVISANGVGAGWIILYGLVFGAIIGALLGAILQAAAGGQRDFRSARRMTADHYDVMVDSDIADEAVRLLDGGAPTRAARTAPH